MDNSLKFNLKILIAADSFKEEQVKKFVENNIFAIDNNSLLGRRCIDGRETNVFAEALPGADAGYLLATISALRELKGDEFVDENRNKILETVSLNFIDNGEKFYFHTDTHAEHDYKGVAKGCGHLRLASEDPHKYALIQKDIDEVFKFLEEKVTVQDVNFVQVILKGDHQEKAVLIVDRDDISIKAFDQINNESVFIFTSELVKSRIDKIAAKLAPIFAAAEKQLAEVIWEKLNLQLEATRQSLAEKLPVYQIS